MTKESATALPRRSKQRRSLLLRSFVILQTALLQDPLGVSLTTTNSPSVVAFAFVREYTKAQKLPHRQWPRDNSDDAWVGRRNPPRGFREASSTMVLAGNTRGENEKATISTGNKDEGDTDFENMNILNDLVIASSLSYLSLSAEEEDTEESLSKMEASPYFATSSLNPLAQVVEPKTESGATVFEYSSSARSNDKCIVVACRGSATPVNFSTNLRFKLVPLQGNGSDDDEEWLVHEGFQDATQGLWELLAPQLETLTSQTQSDSNGGKPVYSQIIFTGHSLGAANALLCAVKYQSNSSSGIPLGGVITFGGPRLVNTALAKQWNSGLLESVTVKNYVHSKDPILRQNGPLWDSLGFGIVGREVPCEPFEARAYHSPQDQQEYATKELPLAWNILDHCNYLGVFVGPRLF